MRFNSLFQDRSNCIVFLVWLAGLVGYASHSYLLIPDGVLAMANFFAHFFFFLTDKIFIYGETEFIAVEHSSI